MNTYNCVDSTSFAVAYEKAHRMLSIVADNCTAPKDVKYKGLECYLAEDRNSGYGVTRDGELVCVWSRYKGRGDALIRSAISGGAYHLNCFDGYLVSFYAKHGFEEVARQKNWTDGQPDVVYMELSRG